jgi:hypothetical protein
MILLGMLIHAATPTWGMVCGPAVPDKGIGAARSFVAGAPIVDRRGEQSAARQPSPDTCKVDGTKGPPKGVGIPVLKAPYVS